MVRGESSSSSSTLQWKYHVFLSFRGYDLRLNFIDHLYAALVRKGIITFRDDKQLEKSDIISEQLFKSIEQSLAAIVVFSENYASSSWTLEELRKILESEIPVFPIFVGVRVADVGHQLNTFAKDFEIHSTRYEQDKVQKWRDCLKRAADIDGWDSKNMHETELIEDVIEKVWIKLLTKLPSYNDGVVGIDSRVRKMISLLSIGSQDVRFVGIWGMAGVGKTTLARVIFERICGQFEIFCFLSKVGEGSKASDGLVSLQTKLLSHLKISNLKVDDLYDGRKKIRNLLCNKKVLLVLDDINDLSQLKNLAENKQCFGPGSRVIVTTRDKHLLVSHGICDKYKMNILTKRFSLQLFCKKAFKGEEPPEDYLELTESIVQYAGGVPLALEVLGSFVCGRPLCEWEDTLAKIKQVPPNDILHTLRISYDGLEDAEKTLFLGVAFFFAGRLKVEVIQILKDCGLYPTIGISLLIEKSLVTCHGGILEMHDLLREMGRGVVFQESPNDACRRSRLCSFEDINGVLRKNKRSKFIQGIILKSSDPCKVNWDPEAFSKMCNLEVLIILCDLHLPLGLKCLSSSLKILEWKGYPLQILPLGLPLDELVHLKMHSSKLIRLCSGTQCFSALKSIDLSDSIDLIETPNIYEVLCLESLVLKGCKNLVEVHQSVAQHKKLVILNLEGCINLKILPKKLEMNALKELILSGCSQIEKLPEFGESMECLSTLNLRDCKSLVYHPRSICYLKSITNLNVSGCSNFFSSMLNNLNGNNNALEEVDVTETEVPSSDWLITNPGSLSLLTEQVFDFLKYPFSMDFKLLAPLSGFPQITKLDMGYMNLSDGSNLDNIGHLSSLEELYLAGNNFVNFTASIANLPRLHRLGLYCSLMLQTLPELPSSLCQLLLNDSTQLAPIFFNPQRLWKILVANRWNLKRELWFMIPGSEIPPWFENRDYFTVEPRLTKFDYHDDYAFIVSTIVDIPDYCSSSDWIGIAVCLSLDSNLKSYPHQHDLRSPVSIGWSFKDAHERMVYPLRFSKRNWTHFRGHHLLITVFGSDHTIYKHYLTGGKNKVQLIFYGANNCKCGKLKLANLGSRVVCKEDVAWLGDEAAASEVEMRQSRIIEITDELEGDEATSSEPNHHP